MTKTKKTKSYVRLRERELMGGRKSLYLDIYQDGKRERVKLGMILEKEDTAEAKRHNKEVLRLAEKERARRDADIKAGILGALIGGDKTLLADWVRTVGAMKGGKTRLIYETTAKHIESYNPKIRLMDVNVEYVCGFIRYLANSTSSKGETLRASSGRVYLSKLQTACAEAFRSERINIDPFKKLKRNDFAPLSGESPEREYLTIEELAKIKKVMPKYRGKFDIDKAFMFSCYTGLRISDIANLRWSQFGVEDEEWTIKTTIQKTNKNITIVLCDEAKKYLPPKGNSDVVFNLPAHLNGSIYAIKKWARLAGINKNVSFHTARHTYATVLITMGVDIYCVKELLGHSDIKTTEIYAKLLDKKKREAVNKLNSLKL